MGFFDDAGLEQLRSQVGEDDNLAWFHERLVSGDLGLRQLADVYCDIADDPPTGLAVLRWLATALGEPSVRRVEGDHTAHEDRPQLIHGDLVADGVVVADAHLLVTGSVRARALISDYDSRTTILGDVDVDVVMTNGALYVGGDVRARDLVLTSEAGLSMGAASVTTRRYINDQGHPDVFGALVADHQLALPADNGRLGEHFVADLVRSGGLDFEGLLERVRQAGPVFA